MRLAAFINTPFQYSIFTVAMDAFSSSTLSTLPSQIPLLSQTKKTSTIVTIIVFIAKKDLIIIIIAKKDLIIIIIGLDNDSQYNQQSLQQLDDDKL